MWNYADTGMALVMMPAIIATAGGLLLGHRKSMLKLRMAAAAAADPAHLQVLTESARRMEERIHHLESILDSEAPDWRRRSRQEERVDGTY